MPIGAALVDLLIDCSALRVPAMHIDSKASVRLGQVPEHKFPKVVEVVADGPAAKITIETCDKSCTSHTSQTLRQP